ncbi:putative 4-carboxymuconolactone decarboxylase [Microsporum audouinii]
MPQPTFHESFKEKLPLLEELAPPPNNYRVFHPSAESTRRVHAPRALYIDKVSTILGRVQNFIQTPQTANYLKERVYSVTEPAIRTEADVVSATVQHLLPPINAVVLHTTNGKVICNHEIAINGSCTDVMWSYQGNNGWVTIAVLEIKNTRTVHSEEFHDGKATIDNRMTKFHHAGLKVDHTPLTGNACPLSKQAKKYHQAASVADVAIFDWNEMFIFDFSGTPSNPQFPRGISFSESSNITPGATFRSVLLAFLFAHW